MDIAKPLRAKSDTKLQKPLGLTGVRQLLKDSHATDLTEKERLIGDYLVKKYGVSAAKTRR